MLRSAFTLFFTLLPFLLSGCGNSSDGNKDAGADIRATDMRRIEGPTTGKIHDLATMPDWAQRVDQSPKARDGRPDRAD